MTQPDERASVKDEDTAELYRVRRRYFDTIESLLKLVAPHTLGADDKAAFDKIKDDHEWDGLSCYCGGGWLVGHRDGCPEAVSPTTERIERLKGALIAWVDAAEALADRPGMEAHFHDVADRTLDTVEAARAIHSPETVEP